MVFLVGPPRADLGQTSDGPGCAARLKLWCPCFIAQLVLEHVQFCMLHEGGILHLLCSTLNLRGFGLCNPFCCSQLPCLWFATHSAVLSVPYSVTHTVPGAASIAFLRNITIWCLQVRAFAMAYRLLPDVAKLAAYSPIDPMALQFEAHESVLRITAQGIVPFSTEKENRLMLMWEKHRGERVAYFRPSKVCNLQTLVLRGAHTCCKFDSRPYHHNTCSIDALQWSCLCCRVISQVDSNGLRYLRTLFVFGCDRTQLRW